MSVFCLSLAVPGGPSSYLSGEAIELLPFAETRSVVRPCSSALTETCTGTQEPGAFQSLYWKCYCKEGGKCMVPPGLASGWDTFLLSRPNHMWTQRLIYQHFVAGYFQRVNLSLSGSYFLWSNEEESIQEHFPQFLEFPDSELRLRFGTSDLEPPSLSFGFPKLLLMLHLCTAVREGIVFGLQPVLVSWLWGWRVWESKSGAEAKVWPLSPGSPHYEPSFCSITCFIDTY